jgi:hypothetical protein
VLEDIHLDIHRTLHDGSLKSCSQRAKAAFMRSLVESTARCPVAGLTGVIAGRAFVLISSFIQLLAQLRLKHDPRYRPGVNLLDALVADIQH